MRSTPHMHTYNVYGNFIRFGNPESKCSATSSGTQSKVKHSESTNCLCHNDVLVCVQNSGPEAAPSWVFFDTHMEAKVKLKFCARISMKECNANN